MNNLTASLLSAMTGFVEGVTLMCAAMVALWCVMAAVRVTR